MLIDWSQNDEHKTTVAVYSLRARERPTVSTPLAWDEVEAGDPDALVFEADDVLARVEEHGDLFAPVADAGAGVAGPLGAAAAEWLPLKAEWSTGGLPADRLAGGGTRLGGAASVRCRRARRARWRRRSPATRGWRSRPPTPPAEVVSRSEWAAGNLDAAVARARSGGGAARRAARLRRPAGGRAASRARSATLAAEVGLVMGYMSSRVLGQYELSLLGARHRAAAPVRGAEPRRRGARPRRGRRRRSGAGSARTSSRTSSSSRACRGCAST